jgi:hypothetical protein
MAALSIIAQVQQVSQLDPWQFKSPLSTSWDEMHEVTVMD